MKIWKLNSNKIIYLYLFVSLIYIILGGGNDYLYANIMVSKMNSIKSNFLQVAQASSGIGLVFGLILMTIGAQNIGGYIAKGGAIALVLVFSYHPIVKFAEAVFGSYNGN